MATVRLRDLYGLSVARKGCCNGKEWHTKCDCARATDVVATPAAGWFALASPLRSQ